MPHIGFGVEWRCEPTFWRKNAADKPIGAAQFSADIEAGNERSALAQNTAGLERMKKYLTEEPDLAAYKDMFLYQNAERLFGLSDGSLTTETKPYGDMIVRIAEIEVYPEYLSEYLAYATEVDRLSVEREPGVICLFPMQDPADSCQIRILEIYANDAVYQAHLKTDHFQKYKQGTLKMVKSLKLNTMRPMDREMMKAMFRKMR